MRVANADLLWSTTGTDTYATSGDISNASLYSNPVSLRHLDAYAIQCDLSGATVTGTVKLQGSNDNLQYDPRTFPTGSAMSWVDIDGASQAFTATGKVMFNASGAGYLWVRVVWTESGTAAGSIVGTFNGKGDT